MPCPGLGLGTARSWRLRLKKNCGLPVKKVCTVHCVSFTMHCMVASSIPCKSSLCADRAHACAGDSHASSGIDVACPTTQSVFAIASPHELHGDSWPSSSTGTSSFCCNQQYSITAVTTSAGAVAERYAYTAYGQPTVLDASASVLSSPAINNRYKYTGREWDATLELHHFRARWMSGLTGRFLTRDSIGYAGGILLYRGLSMLSGMDPTGNRVECPTDVNQCGMRWVEVERPPENQDVYGSWSNGGGGGPPVQRLRGVLEYEWIAADAAGQTSNCGREANFTIGFQISHTYTYGVGAGGIINIPVGSGEAVEATVSGDFSYSWSTSTSSGVEMVYQEDCYEFRSVPLVLRAKMWNERESRGRIFRHNPRSPLSNTLYVSGGLLMCKRKCCKCCAEVGDGFNFGSL